jgi:hypothetical protein
MGQAGETTLVVVCNVDSRCPSVFSDLIHKTLSPSVAFGRFRR